MMVLNTDVDSLNLGDVFVGSSSSLFTINITYTDMPQVLTLDSNWGAKPSRQLKTDDTTVAFVPVNPDSGAYLAGGVDVFNADTTFSASKAYYVGLLTGDLKVDKAYTTKQSTTQLGDVISQNTRLKSSGITVKCLQDMERFLDLNYNQSFTVFDNDAQTEGGDKKYRVHPVAKFMPNGHTVSAEGAYVEQEVAVAGQLNVFSRAYTYQEFIDVFCQDLLADVASRSKTLKWAPQGGSSIDLATISALGVVSYLTAAGDTILTVGKKKTVGLITGKFYVA